MKMFVKNIFKLTARNVRLYNFKDTLKTFSKHFSSGSYDPDGKTVLNILNSDEDAPLMIDGYSVHGFRLNNGIFVLGPVAIFPRSILSWKVAGDEEINEKSLALFLNLSPKLDVFVIGVSDPNNKKLIIDINKKVHNIIVTKGYERINVEVLPTEKAVSTFNFLNCENRFVGAALMPPSTYSATLDDQFRAEYLSKKKDSMDVFLES